MLSKRRLVLLISVAGLTLGGASAAPSFVLAVQPVDRPEPLAPNDSTGEATLDAVLRVAAKLDADAIEEREVALLALRDMRIHPSVLCEAIELPKTTPEQRERLSLLGPGSLFATMRGALGVSFSDFGNNATVGFTQEGFDSVRVLRPGDQILAIDGQRIVEYPQVRPLIISRDPGQELELRVLRAGKAITVRVKLGRFVDLRTGMGGGSTITTSQYEEAWRIRLSLAEREHARDEIASDLTQADWARAQERAKLAQSQPITLPRQIRRNFNNFDGSMDLAQPQAVRAIAPDARFIGGGEPRGGTLWSLNNRLHAAKPLLLDRRIP